jgi:hypothetical protein
MYPSGELKWLATRKRALRSRIAWHRWEWASAGARLAQPVEVADALIARWRQLSPLLKLTAVPLGLLLKRRKFSRIRFFVALLQLAPSVIRSVREYRASTPSA